MPFEDDVQRLKPGQPLLDAPMAELVSSLGIAVADAQAALDANSIRMGTKLGMTTVDFDDGNGKTISKSLLALGFTPNFYHFTQATVSMSLTLTLKIQEGLDVKAALSFNTADKPSKTADKPGKAGTETGGSNAPVTIDVDPTKKVVAGNTLKIGSTTLKFVDSVDAGKEGEQILINATGAAEQATEIAKTINASAEKDKVKAVATGASVTLSRKDSGADDIGIAVAADALHLSSQTLSGKKAAGGSASPSADVTIDVDPTKKVVAGNTLKIGSTALKFVDSVDAGKEGEQILINATGAAEQATEIAKTINASAKKDKVKAVATGASVTLSRKDSGADDIEIAVAADALHLSSQTLKAKAIAAPGGEDDAAAGKLAGIGSEIQTVNKVVPFGISASVEYNRKYNVDSTSMTKIDATLVSLPAPSAFLDQLKAQFSLPPKP